MNELTIGDILIRLGLATIAGAMVGYPHAKYIKSSARIYAIVCLGGALVMLVSTWGFAAAATGTSIDPARLSAAVIAGMGFLGAGVISIHRGRVYGLPSSSALWLTASIGLVIGLGWFFPAALAVVFSWFTMMSYPFLKKHRPRRRKNQNLHED